LYDQNKNTFLADKGYDSAKIRKLLMEKKYKKIIIPQNRRNIKNKNLLKKLNKTEKRILHKRMIIERLFSRMKSYKRINVRYDKYSESYMGFVHLACIAEISRK
jgi:transposase